MASKGAACVFMVLSLLVSAGCAHVDKRTKCIASGAAIGVAIGAASGAAVGSQVETGLNNNHPKEGALIGAAAGGIIGSVVGMIVCDLEDGRKDKQGGTCFGKNRLSCRAMDTASDETRTFADAKR